MDKTMILPEAIPDEWLQKLHDERRENLARKCYFEGQLDQYKAMDKTLKLILALTSGSVVGLAIWELLFPQNTVTYISAIAVAITAIIGVLQPILGLGEKIDKSRALLGNYERGVAQFNELAFMIQMDRLLTVEEFKKLYAAHKRGIGGSGPNRKKLEKCFNKEANEVLEEDSWRIAYISPKETISAQEEGDKR